MRIKLVLLAFFLFGTLTACNQQNPAPIDDLLNSSTPTVIEDTPVPSLTPSATPLPPRIMSVCIGEEPSSLFLYGDTTSSAQGIRQAIYDGPFDVFNFEITPVILEKMPSLADGDAFLRPVEVAPGTLIVDTQGDWVALAEGVSYRPSGCASSECAVDFTGDEPVILDELVAQFRLLPGIRWSDGTMLTAHDSVYSFEVLQSLYTGVPSELIRYTQSYQALDDLTVEWVGVPGYQSVYETHFLTPLPQHLWGALNPEELLVAELATRSPLGWGAYQIDEWVSGDHISLSRNPHYFRSAEGLPYFDYLVFRFTESPQIALDALLAGECDFVDRSALSDVQLKTVLDLQTQDRLKAVIQSGTSWEQITFGILPFDIQKGSLFGSKEIRQAVAMCVDRQAIGQELFADEMLVPDTFVPVTHPLRNLEVAQYVYDPDRAAEILQFAGWIDHDANPTTARISTGVLGIQDGTPLAFTFLVPEDAERPQVAQMISDMLAACGIEGQADLQEWATLLGPGPEGPIFGRNFDMAQFAWAYSLQPSCNLFQGSDIPGPYPDFPKGWGGGNASGFQNAAFDEFCIQTRTSLPDSEMYLEAYLRLQEIFADELPALPLYQRLKPVVMRPDMCPALIDPAFGSALSQVEAFDYGENCK